MIDGQEGTVVALTSRATILVTPDGNHLRLPSALVFRSVMLNHTRNPSRRFEFDAGVGVQEDLIQAQLVGTDELRHLVGVMSDPPPHALIQTLGDSNAQLRFRGWVDQRTHDFWTVRSEAIRVVKLSLEAAGMDMPEPIYRVQLSEPLTATHTTPTKPARHLSPQGRRIERATPAALDMGVNRDLQQQIDQEREARDQPNLLDAQAPREQHTASWTKGLPRSSACSPTDNTAHAGLSFRVPAITLDGLLSYKAARIPPTAPTRHSPYIESTANRE